MSDKFYPSSLRYLLKLALKDEHSVFGIPKKAFFMPHKNDPFKISRFGKTLETPLGVAAGPHTQLCQNIVAAWLCGARFIELKTVQTLDRLDISKPCISMKDEGYNCEWSQELEIDDSFNEYLNAWIVIHVLNHKFNKSTTPGTIFNLSVGYDMDGILRENMQWFLDKMNDCSDDISWKLKNILDLYPELKNFTIPKQISDNVTISTMHGCPPDEIEQIARYFIEKRNLHTTVKLNPTLLGAKSARQILNKDLGFDTEIPDIAFEHDLKYKDAVKIIKALSEAASKNNVEFGIKLTNTLETKNIKNLLPAENEMLYMSGRALHPLSVKLAEKLQKEFNGKLDISFAGGADCFNFPDLVAAGLSPVTVCSDVLKPGGYGRLVQYVDNLKKEIKSAKSKSIKSFIINKNNKKQKNEEAAALKNLTAYAKGISKRKEFRKSDFEEPNIKSERKLGTFDCIAAPCAEKCPANQEIPSYIYHTEKGNLDKAFEIITQTNPFPSVTGVICDQTCQQKCTRINYDSPLHIREIKRYVSEKENSAVKMNKTSPNGKKVAIIGAGPAGLSCASYLAKAGFEVNIYEKHDRPGGMVSGAIPSFRLSGKAVHSDIGKIEALGVKIHFTHEVNRKDFEQLWVNNDYVYISAGAQKIKELNIPGIDTYGVLNSVEFLMNVRQHMPVVSGNHIVIVGGGNTAMDTARTAMRLVGENGSVNIVYRRTIKEMPADRGEIKAVIAEGINITELTHPERVKQENGRISGIVCSKMEFAGTDNDGRPKPKKIDNSEFFIKCDTLIPAIGQELDFTFLPGNFQVLETGGNTSIDNVFIGGDALRGADTAINAIADGKNTALRIIEKEKLSTKSPKENKKKIAYEDLMLRRYKRQHPVELHERLIKNIKDFKPVSQTLSNEEAKAEASRCLYCDELCNICTTVCPNLANYMYKTTPFEANMQIAKKENGEIHTIDSGKYSVRQKYQILNIADWCNECGNCENFCPTSGAPYKDKPKFYLKHKAFSESKEGYYIIHEDDKTILFYKSNEDYCLLSKLKDSYIFESDYVASEFVLSPDFKLKNVYFKRTKMIETDFNKAMDMVVLLNGAEGLYI